MKETVQVTREDREAAAALVPLCFGASALWQKNVLAGYYDDGEIVQAFTRHRIAALAAAPAPSVQDASQAQGERLALEAIKAVTATTKDAVAGLSRIMAITRSAGVVEPYSELMNKPEVALIVNEPRAEWKHLFERPAGCTIPPAGWRCTRTPGHDGPCAAVPAPGATAQDGVEQSWTGDPHSLAAELRRVASGWGSGFRLPQLLRDAADEIDCLSTQSSAGAQS